MSASAPVPAPSASSSGQPDASGTLTIKIPAAGSGPTGRRPAYLTPSVQGAEVSITSYDATTGISYHWNNFFPLTPQASYCSGTPLSCSLAFQGFSGTDTFTVSTYDRPTPNANIISQGSFSQPLTEGAANNVSITTSGVPKLVDVALDTPFPLTGPPQMIPVRIFVADADGYQIIGNYAYPVALANADTSGGTTLSTTTLNGPSDTTGVTLAYNGTSTNQAQITISTDSSGPYNGGQTKRSATLTPGGSGPYASPSLLVFSSTTAAAQTVTISGAGTSSGPFTLTTGATVNGEPSCGGAVAVSGTSPTFTITPISAIACDLNLADAAANRSVIPILVSP